MRFLSLLLGLAVVALITYWTLNYVTGSMGQPDPEGRSQPKAVLDHTREATKQWEKDTERRLRETERRASEAR